MESGTLDRRAIAKGWFGLPVTEGEGKAEEILEAKTLALNTFASIKHVYFLICLHDNS